MAVGRSGRGRPDRGPPPVRAGSRAADALDPGGSSIPLTGADGVPYRWTLTEVPGPTPSAKTERMPVESLAPTSPDLRRPDCDLHLVTSTSSGASRMRAQVQTVVLTSLLIVGGAGPAAASVLEREFRYDAGRFSTVQKGGETRVEMTGAASEFMPGRPDLPMVAEMVELPA